MERVALTHLGATLFMVGVIVFVQVVHYPLMASVGRSKFKAYERQHTIRTGWVVVPAMTVELACAVLLTLEAGSPETRPTAILGLALLGVVWFSTAVFQAPAHELLLRGFDPDVHRRLVRLNWIRTLAWLARIPVAVALV